MIPDSNIHPAKFLLVVIKYKYSENKEFCEEVN